MKYAELRLKLPSLSQGNPNASESDVWCGRTAASMIQNYYLATRRPGGLAEAYGELVINQRDKPLYELVYRGGPRAGQIAVDDYALLAAVQRQKPSGWVEHKLFPLEDAKRRQVLAGVPLTEAEVVQYTKPLIDGLDLFNPAMIYTGLSSSDGLPNASGSRRAVRHLVCVSGYRRDAEGSLWLHIDDPSSTAFDSRGKLRELTIEQVMEGTKLLGFTDAVMQLTPDSAADEAPGRRYWLRAAALFQPNLNSRHSNTDFWCDHEDSPGFRVFVDSDAEPRGSMVEVAGDPRYPVSLPSTEDVEIDPAPKLWDAVARSGDPYPLSSRRSWHNGIHIPLTDGVTTDARVWALAPGRVVLAWFPERKAGEPDRGMIVMRHAIDLQSLCFVDARESDPPEGTVWLHTLYANLAGGVAGATALLSRVAPKGERPTPRRFARIGAPLQLLIDSGVAVKPAVDEGLAAEVPEDDLFAVAGTTYYAIPQSDSLIAAWTNAPLAILPTSPDHALRMRLDTRQSRLVGVQLDGKPWVLEGDVIKPSAGNTAKTARLFRAVRGAGATRSFPESKAGTDFVDISIDAALTLRPVEVFTSKGRNRALVEVREVVDGMSDNAAEIAAWDAASKLHAELRTRVCGANYADLEADDPAYRDIIDDVIGTMGVQREDKTGTAMGVHVEVFCKQDLTAGARAGGRWSPLVEALGFGNGTADFFAAQLDELLHTSRSRNSSGGAHTSDPSLQGAAGDAQPTTLLSLHTDGTPITGAEWTTYCAVPDHARELSQIVAKHRSEWTLDLVEDASNRVPLQKLPVALRKALFPASLGQPGLDTDTYHYFHPLRFVEWLRTGVDLMLHDLPTDVRNGVGVTLRLGDAEIELVRQGETDNYRLRLVLGDGTEEDESEDEDDAIGTSRGVIVLDGIATNHPEIEIELTRNDVTSLRFTQPGGSASTPRTLGFGSFGVRFSANGILTAAGEENVVHVLSDVGGPLDALACSHPTMFVEARFNVAQPDSLVIVMPGDGYIVDSVEAIGAVLEPPAGGWATAASYDLALGKPEDDDDCDDDDLVTSSATVLIKAIVAPIANKRASDIVQIEIAGGDLVAPVVGEWSIVQRDIEHGARGADVAKLQVYLTQILCGSLGCLRGAESPVASVDGDYGKATSLALWRFLLWYRDWSGPDQKVPTSGGEVELDGALRDETAVELEAAALHEAHGGPKVTQPLLDLVVSYYCMPFIGISLSLVVDLPVLGVDIPNLPTYWKKWSTASRTRVLPLPDAIELHLSVALSCDAPGDLASVPVLVELVDGGAYRLVSTATNLAELVADGILLYPSGDLAPGKKPRLVVHGETRELVSIDLGGATDVRTGSTAVGLDAALIQTWMTMAQDKKGKPYLAKVDGGFGSGSRSALEAFRKDAFKNRDDPTYADILAELRLVEGEQCIAVGGG